MNLLLVAAAAVIAVVITAAVALRPAVDREVYHRKPILAGAFIGALAGVGAAGASHALQRPMELTLAASVGLGMLCYHFVVALHSDLKFKVVDRHPLHVAIAFAIASAVPALVAMPVFVPLYLMGLMLAGATFFLPFMGASDSRALLLGLASSIVAFGPQLTINAVFVMLAAEVLMLIGLRIRRRGAKLTGLSVPMIPAILIGFIIVPVISGSIALLA